MVLDHCTTRAMDLLATLEVPPSQTGQLIPAAAGGAKYAGFI